MTAFSERTLHQLHRLGFRESESYLSNCLVIRDDRGGFWGHMTECEAREKLLNEKKGEGDGKRS